MKFISLKHIAVGLAMLVAAGLSMAMKPIPREMHTLNLEQMIPINFGDWVIDPTIVPIIPSPEAQATLSKIYDQIVNRTYVNPRGERVMLTIAYGGEQTDTLKAHRQEVCYAAQGFQIHNLKHDTLNLDQREIQVTRMLAVNGRRSEPVTYWFTMGNKVVLGRVERLMVQLKYGLSREIPDGMLVRISNLAADEKQAYTDHADFVRALLLAMKAEDAIKLVGTL